MIRKKPKPNPAAPVIDALREGAPLDDALTADREDSAEEPDTYFDFIKDQQDDFKEALKKGSLPDANEALPKMPPPFEQVSLCSKGGGCRYLFRIVAPVRAKMYDDKAPGGMRSAMAIIRRCLVGAVKLDSDDPIAISGMKGVGTEAPYGVTECSHWSPRTDDELADLTERRVQGQDRDKSDEALETALAQDAAASKRPEAPVEDPGADMEPEPDLSAPPQPFKPQGDSDG